MEKNSRKRGERQKNKHASHENLGGSEQGGLAQGDYLGTIPFYRKKVLRTRTQRRWDIRVEKKN